MMINHPPSLTTSPRKIRLAFWVWQPQCRSGILVFRDQEDRLIPCLLSLDASDDPIFLTPEVLPFLLAWDDEEEEDEELEEDYEDDEEFEEDEDLFEDEDEDYYEDYDDEEADDEEEDLDELEDIDTEEDEDEY